MVKEAENFRSEDEKQRERISSKNSLESFAFNMKSTVEDEKVKDKISEDDRKKILDKCDDIIRWLDANQLAEKEEFDHKLKDAEAVCNPIVTKMYQVSSCSRLVYMKLTVILCRLRCAYFYRSCN